MYYKKYYIGALLVTSVSMMLYVKSFLKLTKWYTVQVSVADFLCLITTPREYMYPIYLIFGILQYLECSWYSQGKNAVLLNNRKNILCHELKSIILNAIFVTGWIGLNCICLSLKITFTPINWNEYDSWYFFSTGKICYELFSTVIVRTGTYLFCTLVVSGLIWVSFSWSTKFYWIGGSIFNFVYIMDIVLPYQYSIYYRKLSLQYGMFDFNIPTSIFIKIHCTIIVGVIMIIVLFFQRKDLLRP